jgi:hypothetical protein
MEGCPLYEPWEDCPLYEPEFSRQGCQSERTLPLTLDFGLSVIQAALLKTQGRNHQGRNHQASAPLWTRLERIFRPHPTQRRAAVI